MNDDIMDALSIERGSENIIMVAGVGGAGGNAVRHMQVMGIEGVDFLICNTDQQSLDNSPIENKIQLGNDGLGAGNDPEVGRRAAIESLEAIKSQLKSSRTKMLFITAGMGGGTGTGASPVIAKLAKEMGILTVAIVTSPLTLEGQERYAQALQGIENLKEFVDSLLIINNDNIINQYEDLSLYEAFSMADDILCSAAKGIAEIITVKSDFVNVDFADVKRVMTGSGSAHMSVSEASGDNRAIKVAELSLSSPLLDNNLILGAKNILINFASSEEKPISAKELSIILKHIQSNATFKDSDGKIHSANIIWGTSKKRDLGDKLELVVVATGFGLNEDADVMNIDDILGESKRIKDEIQKEKKPVAPSVVEEAPVVVAKLDQPIPTRRSTLQPPPSVPKQVVLEGRESRYANIGKIFDRPAYQTRQSQLIEEAPSGRREVLKDISDNSAKGVDDEEKSLN